MNKKTIGQQRFLKEVSLVDKGFCPICEKKIEVYSFRDTVSFKEFKVSGLCQECQDKEELRKQKRREGIKL